MIQEQLETLMDAYNSIKSEVRRRNPHLYERWKAGGFLIDNDVLSMYPNLQEVVEYLNDDESEDEDEDEDEDAT